MTFELPYDLILIIYFKNIRAIILIKIRTSLKIYVELQRAQEQRGLTEEQQNDSTCSARFQGL